MVNRLTIKQLHDYIGITPDIPGYGEVFGPRSREALSKHLSNLNAPALTEQDFKIAGARLGVPGNYMRGVRKVEAPRGPFDDLGRPTNLHERHKFRNNTVPVGRFDRSNPDLSGPPYGPGGYGSFSSQFDKFSRACALDPEAAFRASSWGAFQVLGENAVSLGYPSAYHMVKSLTESEAAHLESFCRFVEVNGLVDELRACRPNDPDSCIPFVSRYNGSGFRKFDYHNKLAKAIA